MGKQLFETNTLETMNENSADEIIQSTEECLKNIKSDDLHRVRNEAKLRAVSTAKSYDEFK
jgi:hypothetical protein